MALFVLVLLILLIAVGGWAVVKVALGVAIGLVLAMVVLTILVAWWLRRKWREALAGLNRPPQTVHGSSRVEVLTPPAASPGAPRSVPPHTVIDVTPLDEHEDPGSS
jgi:membrane protein implicated in regulation of membrane protease activity